MSQTKAQLLGPVLGTVEYAGDVNFDSGTLFVDSTNNRVGIGTTNPSNLLTIADNSYVAVGKTWGIDFRDSIKGAAQAFIYAYGRYDNNYNTDLIFGTIATSGSAVERLRITDFGNVGIGTTNPSTKLHVIGGTTISSGDLFVTGGNYFTDTTSGYFWSGSANYNAGIFGGSGGLTTLRSSGDIIIASGGNNERIRVLSTGNIGIGTDNPLTKLDVRSGVITSGSSSSPNGSEILRGFYSTGGEGALTVIGTEYSTGGPVIGYGVKPSTTASGSFLSSTSISLGRTAYVMDGFSHRWYSGAVQTVTENSAVSTSEVMRLTSTGNVGIGTVGPGSKLHVEGAYPQIIVNNPTAGSGSTISFRNAGTIAGTIGHLSTTAGIQFASDSGATAANILTFSDGYLGIGENNPSTAIFVMANTAAKGSVAISANQNVPVQFVLQQGYNGRQGLVFASNGDPSNTSFALINNQGGKRLTLQTASYDIGVSSDLSTGWSEKLCVTSGGNVGIGTTNPGTKLDVHGNSAAVRVFESPDGADVRVVAGGSTGYIGTYSQDNLQILSGGATAIIANTSQNVGIGGAITPDVRLHINGANAYPATSGTTPTGFIALRNTAGSTHGAYIGVANAAPWGTWIQAQDKNNLGTSYPILLNPNGGNVGIGTTNPTEKLHVHNGSIRTDGLYGRRFTDFTSTSGTTGYIDTGFAPDTHAAVYQLYISVNPLTAGSSAYRDVVYGKVFYGTGWNGSTVTSYIYFVQESPSRMYNSGGSEIFVDVLFLRNGVMYNTLPFSDLYTNTQFRIVVDSPSQVGTYISATFHRVHY